VSLLWRNHTRIGFCADRLIVAGYRRGFRPSLSDERIVDVDSPAAKAGAGIAPWQAAVDALPDVIAHVTAASGTSAVAGGFANRLANRFAGNTDVTVILSNQFVRYALLPPNEALKSEEEWLAFARHRLAGVHGSAVEEWALRSSSAAPQGPRVVSAVDKALVEALRARIEDAGANLVSVQPFLIAAFNRTRESCGELCWLVVEEAGKLTLALIQQGTLRAIRSRRVDHRWQAMLPEILEREGALLALEEPCTEAVVYTQEQLDTGVHTTIRLNARSYEDLAIAWG
jgi:hypothetical protein